MKFSLKLADLKFWFLSISNIHCFVKRSHPVLKCWNMFITGFVFRFQLYLCGMFQEVKNTLRNFSRSVMWITLLYCRCKFNEVVMQILFFMKFVKFDARRLFTFPFWSLARLRPKHALIFVTSFVVQYNAR